jgi:hypothetical protein
MLPLVLSLALTAPAAPPAFLAAGTGDDAPAGVLTRLSLADGATLDTPDGAKGVKELVSLRRVEGGVPALPVGPQLVTASGDRIPGTLKGGDAKTLQFAPEWSAAPLSIGLVPQVAAVWLTAPPADTPTDPAKYGWLEGTPPRDVLLYRNGDTVPDGGTPREVPLEKLAAVGFNPRFARLRKPKGPYAHLVLADGTRLDASELALTDDTLVATAVCGPEVKIPLTQLVSLDVLQGPAVYLSDLKPRKAETSGFLGDGWAWAADRTVRGQPLRLFAKVAAERDGDGPTGPVQKTELTADKGLGTHPKTVLVYDLAGKYSRFESLVGLDAATGKRGRATVSVLRDGTAADLPALKTLAAGAATPVRLDVRGVKELTLVVDFGPTGDVQADVNWADARLIP